MANADLEANLLAAIRAAYEQAVADGQAAAGEATANAQSADLGISIVDVPL